MKTKIKTFKLIVLFVTFYTFSFSQWNPAPNWKDSYEANGFCWCDSNFDHGLSGKTVRINGRNYSVVDVCDELKNHPNYRNPSSNDYVYNDIQCGNGPANDAADEEGCPGRVDMGSSGCNVIGPKWDMNWLSSRTRFGGGDSNVVTIRKSNAMRYALDGNNGGSNGQNVYLWRYNQNNVNQQWVEIDRGGGFYSYQKKNTNYCLDGGNGGGNGQNLYLWRCSSNNRNQHWKKVNVDDNTYALEKRNARGYSIDGNRGGSNRQNTYLWSTNNNNGNQRWVFTVVSSAKIEQQQDIDVLVYPNPFSTELMVELPTEVDSDDMTIQLIDLTGRIVFERKQLSSGQVIKITDNLPSGVYALKWVDEENQLFSAQKVVKQ